MANGIKTGGRQTGTPNKSNAEIRELAGQHAQAAIKVMADLMNDEKAAPALRLNAAQALIERAYGRTQPDSPAKEIISRFMSGEISGIQAALELEAHGLKVGDMVQEYARSEIRNAKRNKHFNEPEELPRQ